MLKIFMTSGKCFTKELLTGGETTFSSFRYRNDEIPLFFNPKVPTLNICRKHFKIFFRKKEGIISCDRETSGWQIG